MASTTAQVGGIAVQESVRRAIMQADELSRRAHEERHEPIAQALDALRTALVHVEEALGGGRSAVPILPDLERMIQDLTGFVDRVGPEVRQVYHQGLVAFRGVIRDLEGELASIAPSQEIPSRPLLGVLPLARLIPQDVHSVIDYASAGVLLGTCMAAETTSAKVVGAALGASGICTSALTDYRLSLAKIIPIEAHEAIDHLWGASAIAAPFVFGYWRRDPAVAAVHVMTGAMTILASLITDYRAATGVGHRPR